MGKSPRNPGRDKAEPPRSERLKSALKANLARRKDQAKRRASGQPGGSGGDGQAAKD
ncbi:MAG: hypothetical protein ACOY4T_10550 [Pseudomonadota bacterium]